MGAESSILSDITFDTSLDNSTGIGWTLKYGRRKDGSLVSVFQYDLSKSDEFVKNACMHLKVLRHPCLLRFIGWGKNEDGPCIVTERVHPVETVLDELHAEEICSGLHNIIEALSFLHERGCVCHNNVSMSSVFIADDGSWKLGGMEFACRFDQATQTYLQRCKEFRDSTCLAPEERKKSPDILKDFPHARDAYGFGILAESLLNLLPDQYEVYKSFHMKLKDDFLNSDPRKRPKINVLMDHQLFRNDFHNIVTFLKEITLKSEKEKDIFFRDVVDSLKNLPEEIIGSRLVRLLLSRFVIMDKTANDYLLPNLLLPKKKDKVTGDCEGLISESLYKKYVIPELYKIFHVRDAHVRRILLQFFPVFYQLFDKKQLKTVILPQILLSVKDVDDDLVSMSLHALADLIPVLGGDIVIGCQRSQIFSQGKPDFDKHNVISSNLLKSKTSSSGNSSHIILSTVDSRSGATIQDLAKEGEREKRREELRLKNEERKKMREMKRAEIKYSKSKTHKQAGDIKDECDDPLSEWPTSELPEVLEMEDNAEEQPEEEIEEDIGEEYSMTSGLAKRDNSPPPPVNVDWSDVMTTIHPHKDSESSSKSLKGALKLKISPPKTKCSPPPDSVHLTDTTLHMEPLREGRSGVSSSKTRKNSDPVDDDNFGSDNWGSNWDFKDYDEMTTRTDVKSPGVLQSTIKKTMNPNTALGAEFDIMSLDIKVQKDAIKSDDFDFFADMEPDIGKHSSLMDTLTGVEEQSTKPTLSFSIVQDNADDAEAGWDEEGWGSDF